MRIDIPYTPRYPEIHKTLEKTRFCVIVAHRRFGKTVLAINHMIKMALLLALPRGVFAYVAPFRNQAKKNAWTYLKHYTAAIPNREINESELAIRIPARGGAAEIRIYGADNPHALRGSYLDGVILDEVAQMKPEVWAEVVEPMLADRRGWALFIGTPRGVNLFSELYHKAASLQAESDPAWAALRYPVDATNVLPLEEVERLRREQSDNVFRQEFLCDFTATSDDTLIGMDEVNAAFGRRIDPEVAAQWPLVVGVDVARFGNDATVFFRRRGLMAYEPTILRKLSNVDVAHRLMAYIAEYKPKIVNIDQGQGTGVIDLVRDLAGAAPPIIEVPFGSRATKEERYANRRAEMWDSIRQWLRSGGCLPAGGPAEQALRGELTAPTYSFDTAGRLKLERKEDIRERLERSPDTADALALTFAVPMSADGVVMPGLERKYGADGAGAARDWLSRKRERKRYDPFK